MYDFDGSGRRTKHVSMYSVYQAAISNIRFASNETYTDNAIYNLMFHQGNPTAEAFHRTPHHGAELRRLAQANLASAKESIKSLEGSSDPQDVQQIKDIQVDAAQLQQLLTQTDALREQLEKLRSDLREKLGGRTVFIGGTATGNGDFYPTALHSSCPGVIIHGAIFNAIMTGKLWRRSNEPVNAALTLGTGLLVMVFVTLLTPFRAFLATLLLVGGYLLINGYLLFDKWNLIVAAAGPTVAGVLVWGGLTLANFITEKLERARIERRFRSYVDPALVDFVVQNPKQSRLEGLTREMTMGFTDIESFTALTEKLKEKAIPLVAEYMAEMIPVIRAYNGFVAKLMGDGIYFFYGAPEPTSSHAIDAVETMLGMRKALAAFNAKLATRGMSPIEMRAGVNSGVVIVGDAGTPEASDYTAMGEATNLAARLESGNKPFGTHSMIAQRTLELIGDRFLVRPIAKLQVIGTTGGVQVYEPLARREEATEQQRTIAQITTAAVTAFQESRFADSLAEWSRLEAIMGEDKLIKLYRRLCAEYLKSPPENFDGVVTLKEK
jgi:adenylate cyclase